jgi:hypothetical protein
MSACTACGSLENPCDCWRDGDPSASPPLTLADIPAIAKAVKDLGYTHAEDMVAVWKHRYYTVADVLAPSSTGPDDLAQALRDMRDERERLRKRDGEWLAEVHRLEARLARALAVVKEMRLLLPHLEGVAYDVAVAALAALDEGERG